MTVIVRDAAETDLPGILDIYNDAVLHTTATFDEEVRTLEHRRMWFAEHQQTGFPVYVAVDDRGRVVGWSSLSRFNHRSGWRFTAENSIYVAADCRGQGLGKLLLAPLLAAAERLGLRAILAVIDSENTASIRLHDRFGFAEVGRFKQVGFKFNQWRDVVYLEKLVDKIC